MIKKIAIVGGGTAGWLSAIYLNEVLNKQSPAVEIVVLEDPETPTVGVGEATVHSIRQLLSSVGIEEAEFMQKTQATYKLGIEFVGWNKASSDGTAHRYFHPFELPALADRWGICDYWVSQSNPKHFADTVTVSSALYKHNLSPKCYGDPQYKAAIPYAYHLDAGLMATYLKTICLQRGVKHLPEKIIRAVQGFDGSIKHLITQQGEQIAADFFIDCSGFHSILTRKLFNNSWRSFSQELLCNKAIALQTPLDPQQALRPYTVATALNHGWSWQINLKNRVGNGYVFSDRFVSEQQATEEFLQHLGLAVDADVNPRIIAMEPGRVQSHWNKNCLAVGLSGGFIEPLESTGIYLIEIALKNFIAQSPSKYTSELIIQNYNSRMNSIYHELKDFIVLHYCLSNRIDSEFWITCQKENNISDQLHYLLSLFKQKIPRETDLPGKSTMFSIYNYMYIMYGMNVTPKLTRQLIQYDNNTRKKIFNIMTQQQLHALQRHLIHQ
jgi:2-polyprenyl-6-methoxyphenol hydroxylase-like FAD-dependent oxidoreductase